MHASHNRILLLIGGLAMVATLTTAFVFVATDAERAAIETDRARLADLQAFADTLANDIHGQREAIGLYLLSADPAVLSHYRRSAADQASVADQLRARAGDIPGILAALSAVTDSSATWRTTLAEPAIAAVQDGSAAELRTAIEAAVRGEENEDDTTGQLIAALDTMEAGLTVRTSALTSTRTLATAFGIAIEVLAAGVSLWFVRRYGLAIERDARRSSVLNRFTEVTTFADDDKAVASSNLEALQLLVRPDVAMTHVLNRSKDRAVPEATLGGIVATVLPLHALSRCPGVVRGSIYVTDDASAPLSVHCQIFPTDHGTVACVPLSHGENVGAVHLFWELPHAFPLDLRAGVARIAEHAALAIANRRLLAALHGQANTDARTGLQNSRSFDRALEDALESRGVDESLGVLMLDLDHFKDVNDRHGHPAGDEALRAFAGVLRSCMRDGDVAARYGGEEFGVLLADADLPMTLAVAERIRSRTESTIISLGPGVSERLTVSIGVAMAPDQAVERVALLRLADEALYDAKQNGRNRVGFLGQEDDPGTSPQAPPARSVDAA